MVHIYRVQIQYKTREWTAHFDHVPTKGNVVNALPEGELKELLKIEDEWPERCFDWIPKSGNRYCWISITRIEVIRTRSQKVIEFSVAV